MMAKEFEFINDPLMAVCVILAGELVDAAQEGAAHATGYTVVYGVVYGVPARLIWWARGWVMGEKGSKGVEEAQIFMSVLYSHPAHSRTIFISFVRPGLSNPG